MLSAFVLVMLEPPRVNDSLVPCSANGAAYHICDFTIYTIHGSTSDVVMASTTQTKLVPLCGVVHMDTTPESPVSAMLRMAPYPSKNQIRTTFIFRWPTMLSLVRYRNLASRSRMLCLRNCISRGDFLRSFNAVTLYSADYGLVSHIQVHIAQDSASVPRPQHHLQR